MNEAFEIIKQLVANFKAQESAYLSPGYQESQIRQDFIDKFFTALGWDVTHNVQMNPYQQEVHIENKVHMAGSQRRSDYAFFLAPNFRDPKFFVEAKKPSRNLANADDYYQTIRYGWNANTPIAILTDFEEFHILDCRFKPNIKNVMIHKIEYFHYSDYANVEKFSRIYWLFSREAVASGSLEKREAELPKLRGKAIKGGYQPVDEAFLEELDKYREVLAKAFKKSNPDLQSEELTEAIQRIIDRLVFIRFLEDKQIEEPEIIQLASKKSAWKGFLELCKQLDPKYNGLVFKPHKVLDGKEFVPPDDEEFATICRELSDPHSPYNFDQIPISILGSIYERFLGKVVHATDKRVKVEEKPEVRKAGGVYYTPEYIVRYIVSETVGKLIEGKTPEEIAKMAFADIACGSGSFLIEVYNRLLEYHIRYYVEHPEKQKETDVFERDGKLHLTLKKKKEILLNNVYGVDIDFQATEVTQLSLYLKLLEDVTMHDAHQFGMFKETILPDLRNNIINGNSLIGRDIIDGQLFADVDENKLKPMNFEDAFPAVMKRGGFDAVVGNPPYVFGRDWKYLGIPEEIKKYYGSKFHWSPYQLDMFSIFMEKAFDATKYGGRIGQIVPNVWLTNTYSTITRSSLLRQAVDLTIAIPPKNVFKGITVDTIVYSYNKSKIHGSKIQVVQINSASFEHISEFESSDYLDGERPIGTGKRLNEIDFIFRMKKENRPLSDFADITRGVHPYRIGGYGKSAFVKGVQTDRDVEERPYHSNTKKKGWRPFIYGKDLARYAPLAAKEYVSYGEWLAEPRQSHFFEGERIYSRKILGDRLVVTVAIDDNVADQQVYITKPTKENPRVYYLAGILGSRLLSFFIRTYYNEVNDAFPQIKVGQLKSLPIRTINFEDVQDKSRHDHIVKLVEQMLDAKEKLSNAKTEAETNRLEMQCHTLDRQIDEAVYELYGLTEEEIKIVEGKSS
jgi:adenine-specific DNA-methyltransferase